MAPKQQYYVYVMTNRWNRVLYTGVTNNLARRTDEHRLDFGEGFTARYKARKLVYFECYDESAKAIDREKQIKAGSRSKKLELIRGANPGWRDLADDL
jgi:putative endonuclease